MSIFLQACNSSEPTPEPPEPEPEPEPVIIPIITTIAGVPGVFGYSGDGDLASLATMGWPVGITVDGAGNIYFADEMTSVVRKIDRASGIISPIAGHFTVLFPPNYSTAEAGDGGPAAASHLYMISGISADAAGNIYFAESGNNVIRKVTSSTGIITTIAGTRGTYGYGGDGGQAVASTFSYPLDVAIDLSGNVYVVDYSNQVIRKITASTGIISTVAGSGPDHLGYSGDNGPAVEAQLASPRAIAVDAIGNLYIVDTGNHAIRKVNATTGVITTIAGTGTAGYNGDGGPAILAQMTEPTGITVDDAGNIYIADAGNSVVRKIISPTGIITTIAGNGSPGHLGDGGPATSARMTGPYDVAVDADGNVFITDHHNNVIRAVNQK